jgi:predicted RNA-binding protein YlxR (DUF448 family)
MMAARQVPVRHKHVPQRSCIICRQVRSKRELLRLVYVPDTGVQIDTTGKAPGRGAYLCGDPACWEKAARGDALSKALRVTLSEQDRALITAHKALLAPQLQPNHD